MALRNNPYIPLYVNDFLTDEKLAECSAHATGVYIRLMCIMHKSAEYGKICYNKTDNKTDNKIADFAQKLSKHMPFSYEEIYTAIDELLHKKVINFSGEKLIQKRMVKDNELSEKRAKSGKKGMASRYKQGINEDKICYNKTDNKTLTNILTNADIDIDIENDIKDRDIRDRDIGGMGEKEKGIKYNFKNFIADFNSIRGTKFQAIDKVKAQFNGRLKEGFTPAQMLQALKNAMQDDYHVKNGFKYLTPEFFTRSDKIDKFLNVSKNPSKSLEEKQLESKNKLLRNLHNGTE